ncbi:ABC transporter permease [Arthrobacter bambusae]|uniref:ABC transporter permease n=1 Tax=Arthrobacter bambusae TaxID=1338426 RepID=UPI00278B5EFA|nr:ABC transporter permease [Arthrobacter bambusae]MDQ0211904.1 ribose transport system permease protein [Arthrobacter bambusae]MDQ0236470.1 ribose transport system permease protein [Arthrobacter bambusae]
MNTTATAPAALQRSNWKELAGNFLVRHIMVVVMLLIVAFFAYRSARFATPDNLTNILIAAAPFALIALGQTLVILTGGIDLSVGSVMAVSAMAAAWTAKNAGDNLLLPLVAAVAAGLLAGSINGFIVSQLGVPPFITTLGMLTLASGFAYVIGDGAPINGLPASFGLFANTQVLGLTLPVVLMIVAILGLAFVMKRTNYGLRVYAIGGNRLAAEIAGVRSRRILFSVYAISGLLAGLSGLMLASRVITGAPNLGQGYELDAIAAVVIGGASLMGGRGTVWGTAIGLLLIQTINNGLDLLLVPAYWQSVIKGVIIVAAVGVDVWAARRGRR